MLSLPPLLLCCWLVVDSGGSSGGSGGSGDEGGGDSGGLGSYRVIALHGCGIIIFITVAACLLWRLDRGGGDGVMPPPPTSPPPPPLTPSAPLLCRATLVLLQPLRTAGLGLPTTSLCGSMMVASIALSLPV